MTTSFEYNNYSILTSLNERSIYLKITDQIAFLCYEGNIDMKELRLSLDLTDAYQLICKCFAKEIEHNVTFIANSGTMKLIFNAIVGGYLKINTELLLREKVMSNDSQLTLNFTRLEQIQQNSIKVLTERISQMEKMMEILSNSDIYMLEGTHHWQHNGTRLYYKLNSTEIALSGECWDYARIKTFYNLKKLTLTSCNQVTSLFNVKLTSDSVEELYLNGLSSINSLIGIDKLPNLKKISIISCPNMRDVVSILAGYKHCIKEIVVKSCGNINNPEMIAYCQKNNIKLDLS